MHRHLVLSLVLACASSTAPAVVAAQDPAPAPPMSSVSVYLDCQTFGCDFDYFRTELGMVDWVRDRAAADIHILVTGQTTGSGGQEFTVAFIGLRQFAGIMDTLKYVSPPSSTEDERRKGLAGLFRLGFVRYFARIPQGAKLTITFGETPRANQAVSKKDPWNAWVFRIGMNGFGYGEESYTDRNFNYNVSMDRVTSTWKTQVRLRQSDSESRQDLVDCDSSTPPVCTSSVYVTKRQSDNHTALLVRSVNQHMSLGLRGATSSSRYENHKRVFRVFPAVEYNVFPYTQSTRRQLKFEYNLGYAHYQYNDTTIFDKTEEGMPIQRLLVGFVTRQPWGTIDIGSNASHYLDVSNRYRISTFGEFSIRLFKGFNLDLYGEYAKIKDQFNLAKKDFSPQDILTRQFQLGSDYNYWMSFGISYTFGSVFNSVVNPRMTSGNF
jgi:hypothetical protein